MRIGSGQSFWHRRQKSYDPNQRADKRAAAFETQARKEVPTIDVQKTCQVAAGAMLSLMGGTTTEQDVNACLDSEQKALDQIVKDLATYSSAGKAQCMRTGV